MKQIVLNVPDYAIAGSVTLISHQERGFGVEMMTRNFNFQVEDGTELTFEYEEETK